jgi:hypothetical protein
MSHEFLQQLPEVFRWGALGLPFLLALTSKQRREIIERDDGQSQMRHYSEEQGWHTLPPCEPDGCKLQVHHIQLQRDGGQDVPDNLITLAQCEHTGKRCDGTMVDPTQDFVVHPDVIDAVNAYRGGVKNAFELMAQARNEVLGQGEIYHNPDHDAEMAETALERTLNAVAAGWRFTFGKR